MLRDEQSLPRCFHSLYRRLRKARGTAAIKRTMNIKDVLFAGKDRHIGDIGTIVREKDKTIEENRRILQEKDKALADQKRLITN